MYSKEPRNSFVNRGSYISWEYSEKTRAVNLISIGEIVEIEPETSSPATPSTPSGRGIVVPPLK